MGELPARSRNLTCSIKKPASESNRLRILDLELDLLSYEAGRAVTRSMILESVWGVRILPDPNAVDVDRYCCRGKVDSEGQQPLIRTFRGVGYVLNDR